MSSVTTWVPVNSDSGYKRRIHFDGNHKTISNFNVEGTSNYFSMFGVFNGEVKDLVYKDCSVTFTNASGGTPIGLVGGWIGISNASFTGEVNDVHAINCTVHHKGNGHTGGIGGSANGATITNCTFEGKVISDGSGRVGGMIGNADKNVFTIKDCSFNGTVERTSTSLSDYKYTGGLVGMFALGKGSGTVDIIYPEVSGCKTSGKLLVGSSNAVGGICGGANASNYASFTDCHSTMDIEAPKSTVVGGILGYCGDGTFTDCSYSGSITAGNFVGGIVPHSNWHVVCVRCHTSGSISGGQIVGGIMGQSNAVATAPEGGVTIARECWSTMDITVNNSSVGGIMGRASNLFPMLIENCWYSGTITATGTGNYAIGGIIGDAPKNSTIKNCWNDATIVTGFGAGGIAGRLCGRGGGSDDYSLDTGNSMTGCIYAGTSISSCVTGGDLTSKHYSSGAIIGFSSAPNTLSKNYRNPAMTLSTQSNEEQEDPSIDLNALFDQEDSSPSSPLVWPYDGQGTNIVVEGPDGDETSNHPRKFWRPYHGKAYASGKTISQIAQEIGWSTSVWDLSGDKPALVNNK